MELCVLDVSSGYESFLEVDDVETVTTLTGRAAEVLGMTADVAALVLMHNGTPLLDAEEDPDVTRVCDCSVEAGTTVEVHIGNAHIVSGFANGTIRSLAEQPEWVRGDLECCVAAVTANGAHLADAAEELRCDVRVVLAAVQNRPQAIRHAHESMWEDAGVLKAVLTDIAWLAADAPEQCRSDRSFAMRAIDANANCLTYLPAFVDDEEVVWHAFQGLGHVRTAGETLRASTAFAKRCVERHPQTAFCGFDDTVRDDDEVVRLAVTYSGMCFRFRFDDSCQAPSFVRS